MHERKVSVNFDIEEVWTFNVEWKNSCNAARFTSPFIFSLISFCSRGTQLYNSNFAEWKVYKIKSCAQSSTRVRRWRSLTLFAQNIYVHTVCRKITRDNIFTWYKLRRYFQQFSRYSWLVSRIIRILYILGTAFAEKYFEFGGYFLATSRIIILQ